MKNKSKRVVKMSKSGSNLSHYRGQVLKIAPQPPEFVSRPWFALTVRVDNPGINIGVAGLLAALRSQLGWPVDVPIDIRVEHVKVYGPLVNFNAGPMVPLNVAVQDFIAENILASGNISQSARIIEQATRYPDQVNRACVGFKYGIAHSSITLSSTALGDVALLNMTGAGPGSLVLYHLLFRSGTVFPANNPQLGQTSAPGWFGK